ncbi:MAG: 3,4-dehydroadipyl-CoA semialdehyde dehydrogenase [Myxococcales bacterium]|nr:3,4-dehydroadipyl-CoA semialdehyde dehydrogenase [Myxococcales bacterium]
MRTLTSYLLGAWQPAAGEPSATLVNPATEEPLAVVHRAQDLDKAVAYGRDVGGPGLRALTFKQRGELLSALSKLLYSNREELLDLAMVSGGCTRGDAKFDVDGAMGVLAAYAQVAEELGEQPWILDDDPASILRTSKIRVQHVSLPRHGLAIHINAFNFPAWGMIGKAAVALLAGMPVLSKPATSTCLLAHRIAELIVEANVLPAGAFQFLAGSAGDLLDHVGPQDVIAFTGSAAVGAKIRGHRAVLANNVRVNIEADSLNAVVFGPDLEQGTELFDLAIRDAVTELTQKTGQKCTATRRILVPEGLLDTVREVLAERLGERAAKTGDPADKGVKMGPLATAQQLADARAGIKALEADAKIVRGNPERAEFEGVEAGKGFFLEPILLEASAEAAANPASAFHRIEVFGPVATLLPYDGGVEAAAAIIRAGEGSLVSTVYSDDREFTGAAIAALAPHLGRLVINDEKNARGAFSPGCVFPQGNHGGPGRAGCGAELGGTFGLDLYTQRTAIQGGASQLARVLGKRKSAN